MSFVDVSIDNGIATVILNRGKVNALNEPLVGQIDSCFRDLESNADVRAIILTGHGKFFSFGFDIPELLSYSKTDFARYLTAFTDLYRYLFLYPKPIVAAVNGHAIAGGCMLATTADYRIMVTGKPKISLNEITFGASVFAGSVEMLRYCVGDNHAQLILLTGTMYSAEEAKQLSLIDHVSSEQDLMANARKVAHSFGERQATTFASLKGLLRKPVAERMTKNEARSIREFIDIWYSEQTQSGLRKIKIRG